MEEDLRSAYQFSCFLDGGAAARRGAQIHGQRPDLAREILSCLPHGVEIVLASVGQRYAGALSGQAQRAGSAKAAGAEDKGGTSIEREPVLHGVCLSFMSSRIVKVTFNIVTDRLPGCPGPTQSAGRQGWTMLNWRHCDVVAMPSRRA